MFLKGKMDITSVPKIIALSILKSEAFPITKDEFRIVSEIPWNKWIETDEIIRKFGVDISLIYDLARKGLILVDEKEDKQLAELKRNDDTLFSNAWDFYAALYHFMTKWHGINFEMQLPKDVQELKEFTGSRDEAYEKFVQGLGKPPSHFHKISNPSRVRQLPVIRRSDGLYEILLKRKTSRAFDTDNPMTLNELSTILYYVYGAQGYSSLLKDLVILKKTSPSGGGLHPTEVYPLIMNVAELEPGIYHYDVQNHSLELMVGLGRDEARELAKQFTAGQTYFSLAGAVFIMTARFYRNMWKYRWNARTYTVLLMDAAHLSQTLYLVCAELGLGAYVTTAINNADIEQKLGLDGFQEGVIAISGCGRTIEENRGLEPEFSPYVPRETDLK
jgi:putative peptide maturation dehydrogenase